MLDDAELAEWCASWDQDFDLIFAANNEMIRYHRGEHFGSAAWREDWVHYSETGLKTGSEDTIHYSVDPSGQGELF